MSLSYHKGKEDDKKSRREHFLLDHLGRFTIVLVGVGKWKEMGRNKTVFIGQGPDGCEEGTDNHNLPRAAPR